MNEALTAIVAQTTGTDPASVRVSLRLPLEIQSNRLYDAWVGDRHLIVKEFLKPAEFDDAPRREIGALERLAPLDVAPQPVYLQPMTSEFGPLVLYEYMEGEMWGRRRPSAAELGQLAEVWLKASALPTEGLWLSRGYEGTLREREETFLAQFQAYAVWAESQFRPALRAVDLCFSLMERCRAVAGELDDCDPPLCFCKSDPRFANVIRRPNGRLGLIDWEDSGLRDPARDLADVMTHPYQEELLAFEEWRALLDPYLIVRGEIDPQLAHRVHLYLAIFPVFWLSNLVRAGLSSASQQAAEIGQLSEKRSHGMPLNDRLRRYLARGLAWPETDFAKVLEALADVLFFPVFQPSNQEGAK
jgi:hypothetical protein